ncbi:MAG TPA: YncE family protein [Thermoanaerobaculia bacterium]|nr:YncE family protein [Thermoanaerobaculia bacterium]
MPRLPGRNRLLAFLSAAAVLLGSAGGALQGVCGPFLDVNDVAFCPFVLEIFYLGITTGTTATTYDPTASVSRLQMAAFLSRTVDSALKRGSRRAALDQFWTSQNSTVLGITTLSASPHLIVSDGADVWVPINGGLVVRVRGSDGRILETWTGATNASGSLSAMGKIFVVGDSSPGRLHQIDPSQPAGAVTTVASNLGNASTSLTFDGARIWTADGASAVSIITPGAAIPWTVTVVGSPSFFAPAGILFDGSNVWITDQNNHTLMKLDSAGAVLLTVTVGNFPQYPVFDGTNIWVPNRGGSDSVSVVRPATGAVLATLTGNGLNSPIGSAFDGQRVLITNLGGNSVSLFKAADLSPIGSFTVGSAIGIVGACSDGTYFWLGFETGSKLARF